MLFTCIKETHVGPYVRHSTVKCTVHQSARLFLIHSLINRYNLPYLTVRYLLYTASTSVALVSMRIRIQGFDDSKFYNWEKKNLTFVYKNCAFLSRGHYEVFYTVGEDPSPQKELLPTINFFTYFLCWSFCTSGSWSSRQKLLWIRIHSTGISHVFIFVFQGFATYH